MSLYKQKLFPLGGRPVRIGNIFVGRNADLSPHGYYALANAAPTDAPEGQRYVDSGNGTYDEGAGTYMADWVLEDILSPPAPYYGTKITHWSFRKRFTPDERDDIELAAGTNAALRRVLKDWGFAAYTDLADPDLAKGLFNLEAGSLLAAGRAQEILGEPVKKHERFIET